MRFSKQLGLREFIDENPIFGGRFGVEVTCGPEVEATVAEMKNRLVKLDKLGAAFKKLEEFRIYILSLDGYGFQASFEEIQKNREGFDDMEVEELIYIFLGSNREEWDRNREYYFSMFEAIEDKLEQKGIDLGFDNLYYTGA